MAASFTFEKLAGRDNYQVWKRHMKSYLVIKDLWKYTQTELKEDSKPEVKDNDLKALSTITLFIEPRTFSHIENCETARDAWNALEKSLSDSGLSRKVALLKQLTHTKLVDLEDTPTKNIESSSGEVAIELSIDKTTEAGGDDTENDKGLVDSHDVLEESDTFEDTTCEEFTDVYDDDIQDSDFAADQTTNVLDQARQSIRIASLSKPDYRPPEYGFNVVENINSDPTTFEEAVRGPQSELWKEAMKLEYDSLMANKTWSLRELPDNKKAIHNKWVYKVKRNSSGQIEKYKARLVAKGFSQLEGIDYKETFAPVVRYTSIRYLIALAAKLKLSIRQMDAVTAFLNGELHEDIYMRQPKGFDDKTGRVCKLHRSLYGLKQSSRVWNQTLNNVLLKFGLKKSSIDQCIYYLFDDLKLLLVAIYVNDVLLFSNGKTLEETMKNELCKNFKMKDMGAASSVLGIRISRDDKDKSISIDRSHYISEILNRFGMEECNPISTPVDANQKLSSQMCPTTNEEKNEMSKKPYMQAVGSLLFASQLTRPDISYAVNLVSRFGNNPGKAHWAAVKRIMRYLKGTINKTLTFYPEPTEIEGYCDADYAGDLDGRRTTTGYIFMYQSAAFSWASKL